jgi:hypothetical protein
MLKFHVDKLKLNCLSDILRNLEREIIAKFPSRPVLASMIRKSPVSPTPNWGLNLGLC